MTDHKIQVKNPLFNASVTGGTLEDFSQNALLLPAMEKPVPPVFKTPEPTSQDTHETQTFTVSAVLNPVEYIEPTTGTEEFTFNTTEDNHPQPTQTSSNFSTLLSSFSNYLKIGSENSDSSTQPPPSETTLPVELDSSIGSDNNAPPVPLFSAEALLSQSEVPKPLTIAGPVNTYRRSGFKRPEYAQVPGLTGISAQSSARPPQTETTLLAPVERGSSIGSGTNAPPIPLFSVEAFSSQPEVFNPSVAGPVNNFPRLSFGRPHCASGLTGISAQSSAQPLQTETSFLAPVELDSSIGSDINAPPVPLFSVQAFSSQPEVPKPLTVADPVNSYRRSGFKRPDYAQVPGLTGISQQLPVVLPEPFPPLLNPSQSIGLFLQPQSSISPASSTSSIQEATFNLSNQFKPINPIPPSFPAVKPDIPFPQHSIHSMFQENLGPVMDAIPASEAMPSRNDNVSGGVTEDPGCSRRSTTTTCLYRPINHHWFYKKEVQEKPIWQPFSMVDSLALEHAFTSNDLDLDKVMATDGGRYDVNILRRQRLPVYWKGTTSEVRRCSWFHKNSIDGRYIPYEENVAAKLEEEFKLAFESNQWHRKVELANAETVIFHGPDVLVLFPPTQANDPWSNGPNQVKPRVVKRGMDEFEIDEGEPAEVDHLLFMVHGIGSVCDLKLRTVEEVVDEFRNIALQLVQSHYRSSCEEGITHRVEVLPVSWHDKLHSEETGVDKQLKNITLESIPRLREFTNDTLLDVLFYTSPLYSQTIISTVGDELNNIYSLFKTRNPSFKGGVSLSGHSLGSLILFDLLAHQHPEGYVANSSEEVPKEDDLLDENSSSPDARKISRRISYMMGSVGAGQSNISYPHLNFNPKAFFALGSPIGMFVTVRGLDRLGDSFSLPTCPVFLNIFHPYDPVAYRIEALVNPELSKLKPVLIPHHKGRKRMHLELKETMAKVGADLKQKVFESMRSTWNSFYQLAVFHRQDQPALEAEVTKSIQKHLETTPEEDEREPEPVQEQTDIPLGNLNNGRRIDYVLQEAPFEFFNEYIFALTSHVCYWESEDTILMILKEIYSSMDIATDSKIPQQTMTIERPAPSPKYGRSPGADPTYPMQANASMAPPPRSGFVRKT